MSKKDQVSIFVPTFNSETTIVETIKSILDQSYENITITIIDNAYQLYPKKGIRLMLVTTYV